MVGSTAEATQESPAAQPDALSRPAPWATPPTGASGPRPRPPESPLPRPLRWLGVRGYPVLTHSCVNLLSHHSFIHPSIYLSTNSFIFPLHSIH